MNKNNNRKKSESIVNSQNGLNNKPKGKINKNNINKKTNNTSNGTINNLPKYLSKYLEHQVKKENRKPYDNIKCEPGNDEIDGKYVECSVTASPEEDDRIYGETYDDERSINKDIVPELPDGLDRIPVNIGWFYNKENNNTSIKVRTYLKDITPDE